MLFQTKGHISNIKVPVHDQKVLYGIPRQQLFLSNYGLDNTLQIIVHDPRRNAVGKGGGGNCPVTGLSLAYFNEMIYECYVLPSKGPGLD